MRYVRVLQDYVAAARAGDCTRLWELGSDDLQADSESADNFCEIYLDSIADIDLAEWTLETETMGSSPRVTASPSEWFTIALGPNDDGDIEVLQTAIAKDDGA